jgi:ribosomal protein S18 acetylase RimI-like enzyme
MAASMKFDIRLMREGDYEQVLALLNKSFFPDEPISRCIQLTDTLEFSTNTFHNCLRYQCSFVAYDTQTDKIVGICLNEIENRNQHESAGPVNEKLRFLMALLDRLQENQSIFDRLQSDRLLHIFIVSVDQATRGHGIASRLIASSMNCARCLQLQGAFAEATNMYSLKCFQQQQFDILEELKYLDYDANRLATMTDPNYDRCCLVAKKFE